MWVAAARRCTWLPSISVAPRTVLPSTAIATSVDGSVSDSRAADCRTSQAPITASTAAASAPVTTLQMVAFDGASAHWP